MSLTPVGDYLRKRYPPNDGATHSLGPGDDPGCCAGPHPGCTYDSGWREGLRSIAAEMREMAATGLPEIRNNSDLAAALKASLIARSRVTSRLLLDLADMAEQKAGRSPS